MADPEGTQRKQAGLTLGMLFLGIPLALAIIAGVIADQYIRRRIADEIGGRLGPARAGLEPFLREQKLLAGTAFFSGKREGGDAGPFLNPRITWFGALTKNELRIETTIANVVSKLGKDWARKGRGAARPVAETTWMGRLHEFAYWDLTSEGPISSGRYSPFVWPNPMFGDMVTWAKVRLMEGLDGGDLVKAARDVRQLAWLLHTTEGQGSYYAKQLLEAEREAFEAAVEEGRAVPDWAPLSRDELARLDFVNRAALALAQPGTPADLWAAGFAPGPDAIGRCMGVTVAAETAEALRRIGPGEYREFVERVEAQVAGRGGCRFSLARAFREHGDPGANVLAEVVENSDVKEFCRYAPTAYCRSLVVPYFVMDLTRAFPPLPAGPPPSPDAGR